MPPRDVKTDKLLVLLIFLLGWLTAVVIEDGDLSSIDTARRLQMARSWHTPEPEVLPSDSPSFGVKGPDNVWRAWYGPGQALIMLPAEVAASFLVETKGFGEPLTTKLRQAFVTYTTFPLVAGLGCAAIYLMLGAAGFSNQQALFGTYGMLYGSTYLHYTQVNQENSLMLLCFAVTLWGGLRLIHTGNSRYGLLCGLSAGFATLIRLTTLAEVAAAFLILAILFWTQRAPRKAVLRGTAIGAGIFILFLFLERAYHHFRFGDWTSTYFRLRPELNPMDDFWQGLTGFMLSPNDSVWLYDPLAALAAAGLLAILLKPRTERFSVPTVLAAGLLTVLAVYIGFYAKFSFWNGASAWGSRFTTTPTQMLSALASAWIWRARAHFRPYARCGLTLLFVLVVLQQLLSILFWQPLEENQLAHPSSAGWILGQRAINVSAKLTGNWDQWGLDLPGVSDRLKTWNFMPFLAQKYLTPETTPILFGCWIVLIASLIWINIQIWRKHLFVPAQKQG